MAGGGRSPFTQQEDEYLIKYIAKYNPQSTGRLGNRLYLTLVENAAKKWKWAKAHTWQSWRERYRKNQDEFDRKITKYMRERAAALLEKEFPSQPVKAEDKPSKTRDENDTTDRKPIIDSSIIHAPSEDKGKQAARGENAGKSASSSRQVQPVEAVKKKRSETDHDGTKRIPPKSSKPPQDGEEAQARPHRSPVEDTNGHAAPSTSKISVVEEPTDPISAPVEDTESAVEPLGDDLMQELFGSYDEESLEVEGEELVPDSQADDEEFDPNAAIQSIYPKLPISPIADEPHVPGAFEPAAHEPPSPTSQLVPTAEPFQPSPKAPSPKKVKPKLRKPVREDPFGTPSESSPPPTRPRHGLARAGALPVLVENGFRTTLKRPRRSSVGDANGADWPPKRTKTNAGVARSTEFNENAAHNMDVDAAVPVDPRKGQTNQAGHVPPPRRPVQVNAVASSSKTKLPAAAPIIYQPNQPIFLHSSTKVTLVETPRTIVSLKAPAVKAAATEPKLSTASAKPALPITRSFSAHALPINALSDNDPFTAKAVSEKGKGKGRPDFVIKNNQPLRIDLHKQSLQRRLTNTSHSRSASHSGDTSFASSSSSSSRRKRQSVGGSGISSENSLRKSLVGIGPSDPKFELVVAAVEDITQTLAQMAAACGVVEQIAQATYVRTKSLEKTKYILQQLGEAMAEKEKAIYAAMPELASASGVEDAEDSEEEVPGGLVLRSDPKAKEVQVRAGKRKESKSPTRSGGRPSLSIRPVLDEEDHTLSEYLPPDKSHASRFARLMKQGRVGEAVEREKRRVSGLFIQETQNPRQSSPPSVVVSPTPKPQLRVAPIKIESDTEDDEPIADDAANVAPEDDNDADDIYARDDDEIDREADNESDNQEEDRQGSSPYPTIQTLIKHLSGGRHKEPELLATAQRHRELALGAEEQNAEELREFEKEHDPDMLRLWSVKWAKEILRDFPRAEEVPEDQAADA